MDGLDISAESSEEYDWTPVKPQIGAAEPSMHTGAAPRGFRPWTDTQPAWDVDKPQAATPFAQADDGPQKEGIYPARGGTRADAYRGSSGRLPQDGAQAPRRAARPQAGTPADSENVDTWSEAPLRQNWLLRRRAERRIRSGRPDPFPPLRSFPPGASHAPPRDSTTPRHFRPQRSELCSGLRSVPRAVPAPAGSVPCSKARPVHPEAGTARIHGSQSSGKARTSPQQKMPQTAAEAPFAAKRRTPAQAPAHLRRRGKAADAFYISGGREAAARGR